MGHAHVFRLTMIVAGALTIAGAIAAAQTSPDAATLKNPVASTPESIAAGQQLYLRHCASCHGRTGQGGPGNDLIPAAPSLLGDKWDHGSSDGAIFSNIKNGVAPDFNMVPFKDKLKDDEIWTIVNYIRSLGKK
ncbi:MAG TPA: c-type cytochrome [Vicinamibacterales bacterium]|nr:c-type cytochrome [Vicinamibacterales bacterium]